MRQRWVIPLLGLAWVCALAAGEWCLLNHELAPGAPADCGPAWPKDAELARSPGVFNLLLFVHPHCPCTRATIAELAVLNAQCGDHIAARVVFVKPAHAGADWVATDHCRAAEAIPGVKVLWDEGGIEAGRFGAKTSGQVLLYDSEGRLRFQGGITASRGHAGDNAGRQAICSIVRDGVAASATSPVFGCCLQGCPPTTTTAAEPKDKPEK